MSTEKQIAWKALALILVLALLVPMLAACDDDDDDQKTTTPSSTAVFTEMETTAETVNDEPVKMGICMATSGAVAMAGMVGKQVVGMVEKMVQENGGIQVGSVKRPVEFIWYDDKGEVSGTMAGWKKLVDQEHISVMAMGGVTGAQLVEMAAQSNEFKVPYIDYSSGPEDLTKYPYTSRVGQTLMTCAIPAADLIRDLKPGTVALLGEEEQDDHDYFDILKSMALDPIGAEVVYEQYVTLGTQDITPYLTKIIREEPDILIQFGANFQSFGNVYKNIDGLGGWRDMTYIAGISPANMYQKESSAVGTYQWMLWAPVTDNPGTVEYLAACEKYGVKTDSNHIFMWNALWTAIRAVEQAGSDDPEEINTVLRSGEFQWDAPTGLLKIDADGEPGITGVMVQVGEGGQVTIVK